MEIVRRRVIDDMIVMVGDLCSGEQWVDQERW